VRLRVRVGGVEEVPEEDLVGGEDRAAQVFLEGGDHTDAAEAIAADEDGVGVGRGVLRDPGVELGRVDARLVARQFAGRVVDDVEVL